MPTNNAHSHQPTIVSTQYIEQCIRLVAAALPIPFFFQQQNQRHSKMQPKGKQCIKQAYTHIYFFDGILSTWRKIWRERELKWQGVLHLHVLHKTLLTKLNLKHIPENLLRF